MNCLEFRRKLLIEPQSRDEEFAAHASSCPDCASEAEQASRLEDRLRTALDISSPVGLESRIIAARSGVSGQSVPGVDPRWFALAAGMLLAIGLAGWMGYKWEHYFGITSGLEAAVIKHINDEMDHLHVERDIPPDTLELLLSQFGATIDGNIGRINFVSRCNIRRHSGVHMVIPGEEGPITVLIMPREFLMQRKQVRSPRFSGVIVPTEYGSMAVVGEQLEPVERVVKQMQQSIVWGA